MIKNPIVELTYFRHRNYNTVKRNLKDKKKLPQPNSSDMITKK